MPILAVVIKCHLRSKGTDAYGMFTIGGRKESNWFITRTKAIESKYLD
jgi:hypothetical protein